MPTFRYPVRVHWEDTDAGGIVYHANYLKFMERARSEILRSFGISQRVSPETGGVLFVVADLSIKYRRAAKLEDELTVETAVERLGGASCVFSQTILLGDDVVTAGTVRVACVDAATLAPTPIPEAIRAQLGTLKA